MKTLTKSLGAALAVALLTFLLLPASSAAQEQEGQDAVEEPDRAELTRFAHGLIDVTAIQEEMQEELAGTEDTEEAAAIQQEANAEQVAALEEYDITPERYSQIAQMLETDEELQAEFQEVYQEVLEERDGDDAGHR